MKYTLSVALAASFSMALALPAYAGGCAYGKHASVDEMTTASTTLENKVEEAMTTFDPKVLEEEKVEASESE